MTITSLLALVAVSQLTGAASASNRDRSPAAHSVSVSVQIGLNSMVRAADRDASPFGRLFAPTGAGITIRVTRRLEVGGHLGYERWHDGLGMFGGEWTFRLFKPSVGVACDLGLDTSRFVDLVAGLHVGLGLLAVANSLGNDYHGELGHEPHVAPYLEARFTPWAKSRGVRGRLSTTLEVSRSLTGAFAGTYATVGIAVRIR